ncbi:ABC transporter permease [Micromonospora sp. NPDC050417]|uniref:ABC transporter permease n=1 Tax=Micromonospora sp. NPDC050417 TaxID=3364280 RepID=UPI0037B6F610
MRYVLLHAGAHLRDMVRVPMYWVPGLLFPMLFFLLFGLSSAHQLARQGLGSEYVVTPFLLFTTLNVTLISLSAGVAADRENPWEQRLRLLPIAVLTRFLGRLLYVLVFNVVSWLPLLVVAGLATDLKLPVAIWPLWLGVVVVGAIPFGLLGMALGYRLPAPAAAMVCNIVFLILAFCGGLLVPAEMLPGAVQAVTPYLPTHEYLHLVLSTIGRADQITSPPWMIGLLAAWTVLFALVARDGYRRDEGVRYG